MYHLKYGKDGTLKNKLFFFHTRLFILPHFEPFLFLFGSWLLCFWCFPESVNCYSVALFLRSEAQNNDFIKLHWSFTSGLPLVADTCFVHTPSTSVPEWTLSGLYSSWLESVQRIFTPLSAWWDSCLTNSPSCGVWWWRLPCGRLSGCSLTDRLGKTGICFERVKWIKSYAVIGYSSGQVGLSCPLGRVYPLYPAR